MVSINLMPEMLVAAHLARCRARKLCALLCAVGLAGALIVCGVEVLPFIRGPRHNETQALATEVQSLRETVEARRLQVQRELVKVGEAQSVRAAKQRIAQRILGITDLIPPHVTLSSLHLTEHRVVLAGVAGVRSDVGALARALKSQSLVDDVSIERLREVHIDRHTLQDFSIRAIEGASKESRSVVGRKSGERDVTLEDRSR
jgi:Tfp pilus assembly protein PilN